MVLVDVRELCVELFDLAVEDSGDDVDGAMKAQCWRSRAFKFVEHTWAETVRI